MSLSSIFYFFTPYTDAQERAVGSFFKGLTEHGDQSRTRSQLNHLLQRDIAVINLWTEYRYKGYHYLRKSNRKKLYANLQLIKQDFDRFYTSHSRSAEVAISHIQGLAPDANPDPKRAILLYALVDYFSPERGVYMYRNSSSFGRLLRDPSRKKLVGDCNQIVTLYIYLYSQYFNVSDLQVRTFPDHVALYYKGIDIETTNGTFVQYHDAKDSKLQPVQEIVSINLLDTTDAYLATHEVKAKDFLEASRLAFILSHDRDIVTRNLEVAYARLVNDLMKRNNYSQALKFAEASRDMTLLNIVGHNGASYEIEHHNYVAARRFARHAFKHDELIKASWQSEGSYYYQNQRYHDAIKAFKQLGDQKLVQQTYEALFFNEQRKLGSNLTTDTIKQHSKTVKRMRTYAKKSANKKLITYANDLNKHL
jgi:hypothetical protein